MVKSKRVVTFPGDITLMPVFVKGGGVICEVSASPLRLLHKAHRSSSAEG